MEPLAYFFFLAAAFFAGAFLAAFLVAFFIDRVSLTSLDLRSDDRSVIHI
jgi:hypothetical protein